MPIFKNNIKKDARMSEKAEKKEKASEQDADTEEKPEDD